MGSIKPHYFFYGLGGLSFFVTLSYLAAQYATVRGGGFLLIGVAIAALITFGLLRGYAAGYGYGGFSSQSIQAAAPQLMIAAVIILVCLLGLWAAWGF